jgi:hypothetical protein
MIKRKRIRHGRRSERVLPVTAITQSKLNNHFDDGDCEWELLGQGNDV